MALGDCAVVHACAVCALDFERAHIAGGRDRDRSTPERVDQETDGHDCEREIKRLPRLMGPQDP